MAKKGETTVSVYPAWCKGCGLCAAFCPSNVFELDSLGKAKAVRESECINCGFCELHCPDFAIVVTPKDCKDNHACPPTDVKPGQPVNEAPDASE